MPFPSVLSSFPRPNPTDRLNSPSHSALHNSVSSALGQVEAVIGVDGATSIVGTLMYNIRSSASTGGGHVQGVAFGGTGQTGYAKGDILIAQSSSVLTKLAVGTNGNGLVADSTAAVGIKWSAVSVVDQKTYGYSSSTITWTKPTTGTTAIIEVWAGGGSGGKDSVRVCGDGGGGGYLQVIIPVSILGATESITIGAGGALKSSNGLGNVGGNTVFGSASITAYGGGAGGYDAASASGGGGGGGAWSTGNPGAAASGGSGGRPNGGTGGSTGADSSFGGGGGTNATSGGNSIYGGGGGSNGAGGFGGNTIYGGGGGGGTPGTSQFGGKGGAQGTTGGAGTTPGGGGGSSTSGNSGKGGDGQARITVF